MTISRKPILFQVGDVVCLRQPYRVIDKGVERTVTIGRVEEVLNDGRCAGIKFDYPNILDFGLSSIAWSVTSAAEGREADDLESHYRQHEKCPRCAGEGEIPDTTTTDGGTRLCPGPLA